MDAESESQPPFACVRICFMGKMCRTHTHRQCTLERLAVGSLYTATTATAASAESGVRLSAAVAHVREPRAYVLARARACAFDSGAYIEFKLRTRIYSHQGRARTERARTHARANRTHACTHAPTARARTQSGSRRSRRRSRRRRRRDRSSDLDKTRSRNRYYVCLGVCVCVRV